MKKRVIAALSSAALIVMTLAGCGNNQEANSDKGSVSENSSSSVENMEHIYPFNSHSKYLDTASEIPDVIFHTTGAENGLSGKVFTFNGTVIKYNDDPQSDFLVVQSEKGNIMIENTANILEPEADYSFPDVGTSGTFFVTYSGFNEKYQMPLTYIGASETTVEKLLNDSSFIQENILTNTQYKPDTVEIEKTPTSVSISVTYSIATPDDICSISPNIVSTCKKACQIFDVTMNTLEIKFQSGGHEVCNLISNDGGNIFNDSINENTISLDHLSEYSVKLTYAEGMYKIGVDIPAGEYLLTATKELDAYFEVTSDSTGQSDIVNNGTFDSTQYVTVKDGQYLSLDRCAATLVN